jgi:secreted trypsin-like serine protease
MWRSSAWFWLSLSVIACGNESRISADTNLDLQSAADGIQAGQVATGDPAVGIVWGANGGLCTGTLIAPTVVLTAGHCVIMRLEGFYLGAGKAEEAVLSPADTMVRYAIQDVLPHPKYSGGTCPNKTPDLALVQLKTAVTGVTPVAYNSGDAPADGDVLRTVGFGIYDGADGKRTYGQKREATSKVQGDPKENSITVKMESGVADSGDSGGPLLDADVIVGVTSCHTDGDWPKHTVESYARVDTHAKWIAESVKDWEK